MRLTSIINASLLYGLRLPTYFFRAFPDFLIVGAQKCGTTSLYNYLSQHHNITPALVKEIHYFDLDYQKGGKWYKAHFPIDRGYKITGEASPYYIYHPCVPNRVFNLIPEVKLILLLRNPVDRAYSHFQHERHLGLEPLNSFEDALKAEEERLKGVNRKLINGCLKYSFNHQHFSYLSRGRYIEQIKRWLRYFRREQLLIIRSEDFFKYPDKIMEKVFGFLNINYYKHKRYRVYNKLDYQKMPPETRQKITKYFEPYNKKLYKYLSWKNEWE